MWLAATLLNSADINHFHHCRRFCWVDLGDGESAMTGETEKSTLSLRVSPTEVHAILLWLHTFVGTNSVLTGGLSWRSAFRIPNGFMRLFFTTTHPRLPHSKESTCQCRRHRKCRFIFSWVGKIPWRRKWQPTPSILVWKTHGQRSLVG